MIEIRGASNHGGVVGVDPGAYRCLFRERGTGLLYPVHSLDEVYTRYILENMHKAVINIKSDVVLKKKASAVAARLGLPLGTIINNYLRQLVRERRVLFEEPLKPNKATAKRLRAIDRDIVAGRNLSPIFSTIAEMDAHLDSL